MTTITAHANYVPAIGPEAPQTLILQSEKFSSREAAEAFKATFPKSARFHVFMWHGEGLWAIESRVNLAADGTNGGVNETGVKRYRSILRAAAKAGVTVEWSRDNCANAYDTQAEFESAIA